MTNVGAFITARRDEFRARIDRLQDALARRRPGHHHDAALDRMLKLNRELLAVLDRHEERTDA